MTKNNILFFSILTHAFPYLITQKLKIKQIPQEQPALDSGVPSSVWESLFNAKYDSENKMHVSYEHSHE